MGRRHRLVTLAVVGMLVVGVAGCDTNPDPPGQDGGAGGDDAPPREPASGAVAPLSSDGRWLVDDTGRVVLLHGVNEVYKSAPYYPAAADFGSDDAEFLADQGFTAVRLGVEFQGLMPTAGEIDRDYIDSIATSVEQLAQESIFAERFADEPYVLGYEPMNEPFPGANWSPCVTPAAAAECAEIEESLLAPFYSRVTEAVREVSDTQGVYVEPFVLFNFGQVPTSMPGSGSDNLLSFHSYAIDAAGEEQVVANAVDAAERDGVPLVETEFGASNDGPTVARLTGQADDALVSWMFWAYNENVITDRSGPASLDRVASRPVLDALVRPYPLAVTGTPTDAHFDPDTLGYDLSYDTVGPSGQTYPDGLDTVISVPELHYGEGYAVEVTGARVTSQPCARLLTLRTRPQAEEVSVRITPGGSCP